MGYIKTGVSNKGARKNKVRRVIEKPTQKSNSVVIKEGAYITIPVPNICYKSGFSSAKTVRAKIIYINSRGNYATVEYALPGQKTPLTTTVSLRPITRIGVDGEKHCSLAMRGTGRSTKIGGPMNSTAPTPFGLDVVSASAGR